MVRLDEGGRAAAEAQTLPPRPSLHGIVQHVSIQPGPARRAESSAAWRVVPDTCGHLIASVTGDGRARVRLVGARSTYADIDVTDRRFTVAIRFEPGALPAVIRGSAAMLTDRSVDVSDVFGAAGERMRDRAAGEPPAAVAEMLADFVEARCEPPRGPRIAGALAAAASVDDLGRAVVLSPRALHARMLTVVGLAPKRALRIDRLLIALLQAGSGRTLCWAAAAARYSDQSHFTRESRALLGEPPAVWRRRGADSFKTDPPRSRYR